MYRDLEAFDKVAYNLKWLSKAYDAITEPEMAVWCAKASVRIYQRKGVDAHEGDIKDALETARQISSAIQNALFKNRAPLSTDPKEITREFLALLSGSEDRADLESRRQELGRRG